MALMSPRRPLLENTVGIHPIAAEEFVAMRDKVLRGFWGKPAGSPVIAA
jgi:hypothetical protein